MPPWTTTVRYRPVLVGESLADYVCDPGAREGITYANDGLGADQLDVLVLNAALGVALSIGLDVAQVTNVAGLVRGSTVGLVVRVDWQVGKD